MHEKNNTFGIVWMGGQSQRFNEQKKTTSVNLNETKIFACLQSKPLFLWAFETLESIVDRYAFSFNSSRQLSTFQEFIKQSLTNFPHFEAIIDSPLIPSEGPLQAQLTVLHELQVASKVLTISADMPFIPSSLLQILLETKSAISTLQSSNGIMEPLTSAYIPEECSVGKNFLFLAPFGRADDLLRGVETLTLITVPKDYPSKLIPWNKNINYREDLEESNRIYPSIKEKILQSSQNLKSDKKIIANPGSNPISLSNILSNDADQLNKMLDFNQLGVYEDLLQVKSFFYAGRYAEFLTYTLSHEKSRIEWYRKAATSYWKETQFWMKKNVPFLAIHSLQDCHRNIKKSGLKVSWIEDFDRLYSKLKQQLNITKGRR